MDNIIQDCLICYTQSDRFVPVCQNVSHRCCIQCYNQLVDKSICFVCRQPNLLVQQSVQNDDYSEDSQSVYEQEYTTTINISEQYLQFKIRLPINQQQMDVVNDIMQCFRNRDQQQPVRRSIRIQNRMQQLGRDYRM